MLLGGAVAMVTAGRRDMKGLRDRALLLLGFAGAFRRSELVAPRRRGYRVVHAGLRVRIRRSKTDQEGVGTTIPVLAGYAR